MHPIFKREQLYFTLERRIYSHLKQVETESTKGVKVEIRFRSSHVHPDIQDHPLQELTNVDQKKTTSNSQDLLLLSRLWLSNMKW